MIIRKALALFAAALMLSAFGAAAHAQDSIAKIKERGKLLAGVKFDTPPFGFLNDKNEPVGFDLDLVRKVAEHLGVPVEFVKVTSPTRVPLLVSGNVDLVAASMTHTRGRDKTIDFSITYYTGAQSLIVHKDSPIKGLKDLAGKSVAVQQGTTLEKNIAAAAPTAKISAFKDYNSAWLALVQGRADALTGSLNILQGFAKDNPNYVILPDRFSVEPFGIGVRQGDSALRDEINFVLQDLWTNKQYAEIYRKWFGADPEVPIEVWPQ
ncbi:MAG TPA: transporter substrate-binding domain-containing protein [Pseudolabrys sp.]|nr:transporter substrate-binding domain-containing protein [Pseudolabrys sp.]